MCSASLIPILPLKPTSTAQQLAWKDGGPGCGGAEARLTSQPGLHPGLWMPWAGGTQHPRVPSHPPEPRGVSPPVWRGEICRMRAQGCRPCHPTAPSPPKPQPPTPSSHPGAVLQGNLSQEPNLQPSSVPISCASRVRGGRGFSPASLPFFPTQMPRECPAPPLGMRVGAWSWVTDPGGLGGCWKPSRRSTAG